MQKHKNKTALGNSRYFSSKPCASLLQIIGSELCTKLIFIWFTFEAIYLSVSTKYGIPPDERYHFNFIKLFVKSGWSPILHNQSGFTFIGEAVRTPFMIYPYLLSLPSHFFISWTHSLFILRLMNIGLALASLYVVCRIAEKLRISSTVKNLSLFMLVNTLMFTFLSASVNYDNLLILLTLLSVWMTIYVWQDFNSLQFLLLIIVLIAGLLTALNFIPVAVAVIGALTYRHFIHPHQFFKDLQSTWPSSRPINISVILLFVLVSIIFTQRYILNLARYGNFFPSYRQVNSQLCSHNSSYPCVVNKRGRPERNGPSNIISYLPTWETTMMTGIYGIQAHKYANPSRIVRFSINLLSVLAIIAFVTQMSRSARRNKLMILFVAFYTLVLLLINYRSYRSSGVIELELQGRYIFPVLPLLYLLGNYYIFELLKKSSLRLTYVLACFMIFLFAGLPSYLLITDSTWYTQEATNFNSRLKQDFHLN